MSGNNRNRKRSIAFVIAALLAIFFGIAVIASAEETGLTRIGDLEKENISDEANDALREYYAQVFGIVGPNTQFTNIATKEDIAILNVTVDGRDRRIITKLARGVILLKITDELLAAKISVNNLTVLENLKILGSWLFSRETLFGKRNFYSAENSAPVYVDEGFSRLFDGRANISVNPVLREMISGYSVHLSAEGVTRGIYVAEKSDSYFVVKGINPQSNVGFSWMLRGVKRDSDAKLESLYSKELGIELRAEINYENGTAAIKINGLDKILELANKYNNQTTNNATGNASNNENNSSNEANNTANNESNNPDGQGIQLITGNLVDEFGLETDLGKILSDSSTLPSATADSNENNNQDSNNKNANNQETENPNNSQNSNDNNNSAIIPDELGNLTSNESSLIPEQKHALEFTLYSTDENYIVEQVASVTGLNEENVRKLITFAYLEPTGFADETVEDKKIDGIEKVNGSVIIRLG